MGNLFQKWREEHRIHPLKPSSIKTELPTKPIMKLETNPQLKPETQSRFNSPYPMLNYHNEIRIKNGLPPLEWDHRLATKAEEWGNWLKENYNCAIRHPTENQQELNKYLPDNMGQNLYVGYSTYPNENWSRNAAKGWFSECQFYDSKVMNNLGVPKNFSEVGHFTQMMWKPTKKVGCSHINFDEKCSKKYTFPGQIIVCNYDKGNVAGAFEENVIYDKNDCKNVNDWLK